MGPRRTRRIRRAEPERLTRARTSTPSRSTSGGSRGSASPGAAFGSAGSCPAAEAVRRVMTQMYSTGFVDPDAWQGGRFPTLEDLFTIRTRPRVHRDLDELTLGADRSAGRRGPAGTVDDRRAVPGGQPPARRGRRREVPRDRDRRRHDASRSSIRARTRCVASTIGGRSRPTRFGAGSRRSTISTRRYARPPAPPGSPRPVRRSSW